MKKKLPSCFNTWQEMYYSLFKNGNIKNQTIVFQYQNPNPDMDKHPHEQIHILEYRITYNTLCKNCWLEQDAKNKQDTKMKEQLNLICGGYSHE